MKRIIYILAAAVAGALVMYACNSPYGELRTGYEPKFIDVTQVVSDYTAYYGTSRLLYTCPEKVTGSSNQSWCNIEKVSEGEFELSLEINKTIFSRNAMITLRAEGGSAVQIPISQSGIALQTSESVVTIPYDGGVATVDVYSPIEFEHSASEDWLTYTVVDGVIVIDLPEHSGFPRVAYIYIDLPDQKLSTFITVEQLGNLNGLHFAEKFIGPQGAETVWYFDPEADNGPDFNSAWIFETGSYKHNELKIGRINVSSTLYQCIRLNATWKSNGNAYNTGWLIDMEEGETDDEVVFTLRFGSSIWGNDTFFYNSGGIKVFLQSFTGATDGDSKKYKVANANDLDNPTVIMLRDSSNSKNWFTVTKTPVTI